MISRELKIGNDILVIVTVISAVVSLFASVVLGILQGLKRFFHYGITSFLAILGKVGFSIALVLIGWQLYGPLIAIILGILISLGYGVFQIRKETQKPINDVPEPFQKKRFFQFVGKVVVIQICISLITNGDILLVKYFFSPQEAGLYSSAMVIGKISLYAATAIVAALFPMTMEKVVKGMEAKRLLFKSLIYSGGIAVLCALVLNIFPDFIINLLYGHDYLSSASLLLPISSLVIPVTIFTILMNYQLATGKTVILSLTLIGCIIGCGVVVQFFHSSIPQMIYCLAAVLATGAAIDAILLFTSKQSVVEAKNG
jgi:O-antigen/teichoic acid export membrane protein